MQKRGVVCAILWGRCTPLSFNSLAVRHAEAGEAALGSRCSWQESKLAVLWNIGVFALNFGPVLVGPVLDWVGPKLTVILGVRPPHPWDVLSPVACELVSHFPASAGLV